METIRPFEDRDAEPAAELLNVLEPEFVTTAALLVHRHQREPTRAHRRSWLAVEGEDVIGWASGSMHRWGGQADLGRLRVGVREDRRGRGIGTELLRAAEGHLTEHGARRLQVRATRASIGVAFAAARGYTRVAESEVLSVLDPRKADLSELDSLRGRHESERRRIVTLGEVRDRREQLFELYGLAEAFPPGSRVTYDEWWRELDENPTLAYEGSFVVLAGERFVAVALLVVDRERLLAENDWTATLPELRGQGLARLAKLMATRWALESGIREIRTENDIDNGAMLAVNRRLGYREVGIRDDLEKAL